MATQPVDLVRQFIDGYNDRSLLEAPTKLFDPELVVHNEASGMETQGVDAFMEHVVSGWIRAVPDAHVELLDYQVDGQTVAFTMSSSGTFDGELATPDGTIPGTGESFELESRIEATVDGDRITRWVSDYDMESWKQQVGLAMGAGSSDT